MTPRPVWNPDLEVPENFPAQWADVPDNEVFDNGFKAQWEQFLTHVYGRTPYPYDLLDGARGVQLAHLARESERTGRRVAVPVLEL